MTTTISPTPDQADDLHYDGTPPLPRPEATVHEEHLQLVERIAGSEHFQKSSRLPTLLRYLATCTLANNRSGLSEQAIGRAVFDKRIDFNPTEDSSVRVYIRQLRLRLHEYYQSVGEHETTIIEIPKGGYALAFHSRYAPPPFVETPPLPSVPPALTAQQPASRPLAAWLPWCLFAVALIAAVIGWTRWARVAASDVPPWPLNRVIEPGRPTTMVLADASYILRLLGDRSFTLDEYADHKYVDGLIPKDATRGEQTLFNYLQNAQITSMADARAVSVITTLAGSLRQQIVTRSAKELTGTALLGGNFIILGAKNSNPWVELYEGRMNFRLVEGGRLGGRYIDNHAPQPGESPVYYVHESTGYSGEDYATISLLPGLGEQGSTLIVQGLRREGTEAAIVFLNTPSLRANLQEKLKAANHGRLPTHFEALLRSHAVAGSATSIDCIAVRPLQ